MIFITKAERKSEVKHKLLLLMKEADRNTFERECLIGKASQWLAKVEAPT